MCFVGDKSEYAANRRYLERSASNQTRQDDQASRHKILERNCDL